ncbi:MAG: ABC transporter permease [Dehalococcoidia bacterium]|nr:ABC transporter permease [Dehalococcoidia bacterium]
MTFVRQSLLLAGKDTRIFFKDRFAVVFAFAFPLLFTLGFTLALGGILSNDEPLEITLVTREEGQESLSREIIDGLVAGETFTVNELDYDAARREVEAGALSGFIAFSTGFSAGFTNSLMSGDGTAVLEVVTNPDAPEDAAALEAVANTIARQLSIVQLMLLSVAHLPPEVDPDTAMQRIPDLADPALAQLFSFSEEQVGEREQPNASNFTLSGYLTMFIFFAAALSAEAIARERKNQTLERLLTNGVLRESIIFGKFLMGAYRGVMQVVVLWGVGIVAFGIDLGSSPFAVILVSLAIVFTSSAFGVMLAALVRTAEGASSAGVLASLVLAPLGGSWWPLFITPDWMQALGKLTPHGWANTAFNNLMLFDADFGDVIMNMVAVAAFGVAFLIVAFTRFRLSDVS